MHRYFLDQNDAIANGSASGVKINVKNNEYNTQNAVCISAIFTTKAYVSKDLMIGDIDPMSKMSATLGLFPDEE